MEIKTRNDGDRGGFLEVYQHGGDGKLARLSLRWVADITMWMAFLDCRVAE